MLQKWAAVFLVCRLLQKKYFNKDAKDLTRGEAAQIAACLPNPKRFTVKPLSNYVANRYDDIMRQMNNLEGDPDVEDLIK